MSAGNFVPALDLYDYGSAFGGQGEIYNANLYGLTIYNTTTAPFTLNGVGQAGVGPVGTQGLGLGDEMAFGFNSPANVFGGYFSTANVNTQIEFFGTSLNLIGTESFNMPSTSLAFLGWESSVPLGGVAIIGGNGVAMADLQAGQINPNPNLTTPQPGSLVLLASGLAALGAVWCVRRFRRA